MLCAAGVLANPFADGVISYNPGPGQFVNHPMFNDPARCLGAPQGLYVDEPNNESVTTLGDGGSITLKFNEPVHDDPANPYGLDFIVFSNANFIGGDPYYRWQELAFVEISQDGSNWYLIMPSKLPAELVGRMDTGQCRSTVSGYAEYTPTVGLPQDLATPSFRVSRTEEELYTVPERPSVLGNDGLIDFDYVSGGGDAFDIARAVVQSSPGVLALDGGSVIPAGIDWFRYVRITDALFGDSLPQLGEISAEIDAVSDVRPALSIGEAKLLDEGGYAVITDAVVTEALYGKFFIESPDRSAAFKVISDAFVQSGDRMTITGHISKSGGAHMIADPMFTVTSSGNDLPKPLGMPLRNLQLDMAYGLLLRTWGKVTDEGDGFYCTISDGGSVAKLVRDYGVYAPLGSYVAATGACDREEVTGEVIIRFSDPGSIRQVSN
ncbi:MAG: hypothetical protein A2Z18_00695 [Armatimonadetes bacterium RBG_16_58_9]|nr:MAG: hypothetical protein A2Z18_00695 [Armatimonadetes bacterium RBG_16_58_9]